MNVRCLRDFFSDVFFYGRLLCLGRWDSPQVSVTLLVMRFTQAASSPPEPTIFGSSATEWPKFHTAPGLNRGQ